MTVGMTAAEQLRIEIEELARQITARKAALELLDSADGISAAQLAPAVTSNKYQGVKKRDAMLDQLDTVREKMSLDEMLQALLRNGAYICKDPKRYVAMLKITITQNSDLLVLDDGMVMRKK